jgi:sensor histidine kinase YesM
MGWFIAAVLTVMCGITFEFMSGGFIVHDMFGSSDKCILWAHVFYAIVAPIFTLYFIETERDEGQSWDGQFWISLQGLVAFLTIVFMLFIDDSYVKWMPFLMEYVIIIIMLLISSKDIRASIGFIIGCMFPIAVSFAGMMETGVNVTGIGMTMLLLVVMFLYQIDVERELFVREALLSENKVALMMEQIHPHFIYNSLQQIVLLCDEKPEEVKLAILNFSGYLRKNLENLTSVEMIPFLEEMKHVDLFVELSLITQSRDFELVKQFEITDFSLPALTLQPLVENAIKYGIGMSTKGDSVVIGTKIDKGYYVITVSDDGHGERTELPTQKNHKSVGINNVRTRLKLMCGGDLSISQTEQGTTQIVRIPILGR